MLDKCPECGEPLEASIKVYLDDVVVEDDGTISNFTDSSEGPGNGLGVELAIYCINDHEGEIADALAQWPTKVTLNGAEYGT